MNRAAPPWLTATIPLIAFALATVGLITCGGSTGAGPGALRIKFINRWYATNGELRVVIDACSQEFSIAPGDEHIVEDCTPGGGLTSVLVHIEGRIVGVSYIGSEPSTWEGQVEDGQTVTVTGEINKISVAVED